MIAAVPKLAAIFEAAAITGASPIQMVFEPIVSNKGCILVMSREVPAAMMDN